MGRPVRVDRQTFVSRLLRSGLVGDAELARVAAELPDSPRGRVLARALVERSVLTRFQAECLLAGRTAGLVFGAYRIEAELGKGGMGRVFRAVHRESGRTVALKVLASRLLGSYRAWGLFAREMRAAGRLEHRHIVRALDAGVVKGRPYLAMEFVDGPNADQVVRKEGPLPIGVACELIRHAAEGLRYAAGRGMVHRDVKPGNLLVARLPEGSTGAAVVKLSDFGLARSVVPAEDEEAMTTVMTGEHAIMGTPDFMAPEQARDVHRADVRSDLYSLGCTLYYLLTGLVPFPGGGKIEKLVRQCSQEPRAVEGYRPEAAGPVAGIVRRLMAKDPADRFQTADELIESLGPLASRLPVAWPRGSYDGRGKAPPATDVSSGPALSWESGRAGSAPGPASTLGKVHQPTFVVGASG